MCSQKMYWPYRFLGDTVTSEIFCLNAIDFTCGFPEVPPGVIIVPDNWGRRELRMRIGIFISIAGNIVLGCRTFAPKYDNSSASSNERELIFMGEDTTRGSDVRIPSTSVQICTSSECIAAPIMEAE